MYGGGGDYWASASGTGAGSVAFSADASPPRLLKQVEAASRRLAEERQRYFDAAALSSVGNAAAAGSSRSRYGGGGGVGGGSIDDGAQHRSVSFADHVDVVGPSTPIHAGQQQRYLGAGPSHHQAHSSRSPSPPMQAPGSNNGSGCDNCAVLRAMVGHLEHGVVGVETAYQQRVAELQDTVAFAEHERADAQARFEECLAELGIVRAALLDKEAQVLEERGKANRLELMLDSEARRVAHASSASLAAGVTHWQREAVHVSLLEQSERSALLAQYLLQLEVLHVTHLWGVDVIRADDAAAAHAAIRRELEATVRRTDDSNETTPRNSAEGPATVVATTDSGCSPLPSGRTLKSVEDDATVRTLKAELEALAATRDALVDQLTTARHDNTKLQRRLAALSELQGSSASAAASPTAPPTPPAATAAAANAGINVSLSSAPGTSAAVPPPPSAGTSTGTSPAGAVGRADSNDSALFEVVLAEGRGRTRLMNFHGREHYAMLLQLIAGIARTHLQERKALEAQVSRAQARAEEEAKIADVARRAADRAEADVIELQEELDRAKRDRDVARAEADSLRDFGSFGGPPLAAAASTGTDRAGAASVASQPTSESPAPPAAQVQAPRALVDRGATPSVLSASASPTPPPGATAAPATAPEPLERSTIGVQTVADEDLTREVSTLRRMLMAAREEAAATAAQLDKSKSHATALERLVHELQEASAREHQRRPAAQDGIDVDVSASASRSAEGGLPRPSDAGVGHPLQALPSAHNLLGEQSQHGSFALPPPPPPPGAGDVGDDEGGWSSVMGTPMNLTDPTPHQHLLGPGGGGGIASGDPSLRSKRGSLTPRSTQQQPSQSQSQSQSRSQQRRDLSGEREDDGDDDGDAKRRFSASIDTLAPQGSLAPQASLPPAGNASDTESRGIRAGGAPGSSSVGTLATASPPVAVVSPSLDELRALFTTALDSLRETIQDGDRAVLARLDDIAAAQAAAATAQQEGFTGASGERQRLHDASKDELAAVKLALRNVVSNASHHQKLVSREVAAIGTLATRVSTELQSVRELHASQVAAATLAPAALAAQAGGAAAGSSADSPTRRDHHLLSISSVTDAGKSGSVAAPLTGVPSTAAAAAAAAAPSAPQQPAVSTAASAPPETSQTLPPAAASATGPSSPAPPVLPQFKHPSGAPTSPAPTAAAAVAPTAAPSPAAPATAAATASPPPAAAPAPAAAAPVAPAAAAPVAPAAQPTPATSQPTAPGGGAPPPAKVAQSATLHDFDDSEDEDDDAPPPPPPLSGQMSAASTSPATQSPSNRPPTGAMRGKSPAKQPEPLSQERKPGQMLSDAAAAALRPKPKKTVMKI